MLLVKSWVVLERHMKYHLACKQFMCLKVYSKLSPVLYPDRNWKFPNTSIDNQEVYVR